MLGRGGGGRVGGVCGCIGAAAWRIFLVFCHAGFHLPPRQRRGKRDCHASVLRGWQRRDMVGGYSPPAWAEGGGTRPGSLAGQRTWRRLLGADPVGTPAAAPPTHSVGAPGSGPRFPVPARGGCQERARPSPPPTPRAGPRVPVGQAALVTLQAAGPPLPPPPVTARVAGGRGGVGGGGGRGRGEGGPQKGGRTPAPPASYLAQSSRLGAGGARPAQRGQQGPAARSRKWSRASRARFFFSSSRAAAPQGAPARRPPHRRGRAAAAARTARGGHQNTKRYTAPAESAPKKNGGGGPVTVVG